MPLHAAAGFLLLAVVALSGCATVPAPLTTPVPAAELAATPFFPQDAYQCGPAALATVLVAAGVDTTPGALVEQVWLPGRKGSLQAEMSAATRRADRLALPVPRTLEALTAHVAAGHPVLVLLDLGVGWFHVWHYAVVIGVDVQAGHLVLRSGRTRRRRIPIDGFAQAWAKAGRWGFVTLHPNADPPAPSTADLWLRAVQDWADTQRANPVLALQRGVERWPDHALMQFALGNARYADGGLVASTRALQAAAAARPGWPPAANNLASVLLAQGCPDRAAEALAAADADSRHAAILAQTREEIAAARVAGAGPCTAPAD